MRYIEIILKLAFVILAGIILYTRDISSAWFCGLLVVSLLLGIVLIFNKKSSYNYPQTKRDYIIRRVEGILLIIFAVAGSIFAAKVDISKYVASSTIEIPQTIEDAVRQNGGVYMNANTRTNSTSIADTIEDQGLTNSDSTNGNITLQSGITVNDHLADRFATKSYLIKPRTNEKGIITVHPKDLPLFVTLFSPDGKILATASEKDSKGSYLISADLKASKEYIVEVYISIEQMTSFDPEEKYSTSYSVSYTN